MQLKPSTFLGQGVHDSPLEPKYPGRHTQDSIPMASTTKLALIGDGQARQHGGETHTLVTLSSMNILAGQRTLRLVVEAGDSRPSGNKTLAFHTERGGPSCPLLKGSQCSVIRVREMCAK